MRLIPNNDVCEAHGQCAMVDDDFFVLDDDGYIAIGDGKDVPEDREANVRKGVGACPMQALRIE